MLPAVGATTGIDRRAGESDAAAVVMTSAPASGNSGTGLGTDSTAAPGGRPPAHHNKHIQLN